MIDFRYRLKVVAICYFLAPVEHFVYVRYNQPPELIVLLDVVLLELLVVVYVLVVFYVLIDNGLQFVERNSYELLVIAVRASLSVEVSGDDVRNVLDKPLLSAICREVVGSVVLLFFSFALLLRQQRLVVLLSALLFGLYLLSGLGLLLFDKLQLLAYNCLIVIEFVLLHFAYRGAEER